MKKRLLCRITPLLLIIAILSGCNSEIIDAHINDPIAVSGDLAYYAKMDEATLTEKCEEKHIEITGKVSSAGYTIFDIGKDDSDKIVFSCTFAEHTDAMDNIKEGDTITAHGVCTSVFGNYVYVEGCQLSEATTNTSVSIQKSTSKTKSTSIKSTTSKSTTSKIISSTSAKHTHSFSVASCSSPEKCSCGATRGKAKGHSWKAATCSSPKTCKACGATSGKTDGHNFSGGECVACGKADPDYEREVKVWIPTNGGTKYHSQAGCSNMENPEHITLSEAESLGFTPCKKCY